MAQQEQADCLICSLEMSREQLLIRLLAMETRIDTFRHLSKVAMVFFPGGIGSLHEATSAIDHIMQKKAPVRPIIFFEPDADNPFWHGFFQWLNDTVIKNGLLKAEEIHFVKIARSVDELVGFIQEAKTKSKS